MTSTEERKWHGLRRREGRPEHPRIRGGGGPLHRAGAGHVAFCFLGGTYHIYIYIYVCVCVCVMKYMFNGHDSGTYIYIYININRREVAYIRPILLGVCRGISPEEMV